MAESETNADRVVVTEVERDTIRSHPSVEGVVLVTAYLSATPSSLWQARFSQSLVRSTNFGRIELGKDGASVDITVGPTEQVAERLAELATIVEQANSDVAAERLRLVAEGELQRTMQNANIERVRKDVDDLAL